MASSERRIAPAAVCWCGNGALEPFHDGYGRCAACETIVYRGECPPHLGHVGDEEHDFYGRAYWFERQESVHGLPNLEERARLDLTERCPSWMRTLMGYRLPPARVLEIGAAHGGLVAMARWAGYDASGLEISPFVTEWARRHFAVPMALGPLEAQDFALASFDAILLLDVLEHLPDPKGTLTRCAALLAPGGLLVVQTPEYPAGHGFEDLNGSANAFLKMLIPAEHLFLFSRASVQKLLTESGLEYWVFEPGLSPEHNMTFIASSVPPVRHSGDEIRTALAASPTGRLVDAVLALEAEFRIADSDRQGRMAIIDRANDQLRDAEKEKARLDQGWKQADTLLRETTDLLRDAENRLRQTEASDRNYQDARDRANELEQRLMGSLTTAERLEQELRATEELAAARRQQLEKYEQSWWVGIGRALRVL